ncbi:MAG: hypothetical protein KDD61_07665 [Bdellovibrionales bacterium]|nr:hypothetical protein [Bdellovibrionales bacterium]
MSSQRIRVFFFGAFLLLLTIPYQNCSDIGGDLQVGQDLEFESVKGCGPDGFAFLHEAYFVPQCATCHDTGGIAPPAFASGNVNSSYFWAKTVSSGSLLETSLDNRFCGPACNLQEGSQLHRILLEWLKSPNACP